MQLSLSLSLTGRLLSSFSPSRIFALSEPGVWYDPSDLTTLFQDTAGTTPVTTPGQTVALALDKSKGLVLGSELITAGYDTIFGAASGFTFTSSTIQINTAVSGQTTASIAGTVGRTYLVSFEVFDYSAGALAFRFGNTGATDASYAANGVYTHRIELDSTANITFRANTAGTAVFKIRNISVKELPGFHATQSTAASRPTYGIVPSGGRRNLLTFTEQFDNAAWLKTNVNVSTDIAAPPNQSTTADKLIATTTSGQHTAETSASIMSAATVYTVSVTAKADGIRYLTINSQGSAAQGACFDLQTGQLAIAAGAAVSATSITGLGNGWYRIAMTFTNSFGRLSFGLHTSPTNGFQTYAGDGTSGVLIWGAQLETGSTATAYQRVGSAFDVTEAGVASLSYLSFDGVDDFLVTPTITPGVDKAQVFAGVRKLSDAATGILVESSVNRNTNNGAFTLAAPGTVAANYGFGTKGTNDSFQAVTTFTAPITNVVTGVGDIAADTNIVRANGVQAGSLTTDQGTGNYLAYPLYIGRRGGTTLPLNGNIFSLIVRFGANLDASTITNTERWVGGKTGVTI